VLPASKTVTYGTVSGSGVAGFGDDVSCAGSSDSLISVPPLVHCTSVPTSGDRKKFCCAATPGGVPPPPANTPAARYPSAGACAAIQLKFDWIKMGCE
jgi:hypothetical protein